MTCLVSAKYTLTATLLRGATSTDSSDQGWSYVWQQNPDSGAIEQVPVLDNSSEPGIQVTGSSDFKCSAKGFSSRGITGQGTRESFDELHKISDWVQISFSPKQIITRRDKVTNIRNSQGHILWVEEEAGGKATIFNVVGVTPVIDLFGLHVENVAMLQRYEAQ